MGIFRKKPPATSVTVNVHPEPKKPGSTRRKFLKLGLATAALAAAGEGLRRYANRSGTPKQHAAEKKRLLAAIRGKPHPTELRNPERWAEICRRLRLEPENFKQWNMITLIERVSKRNNITPGEVLYYASLSRLNPEQMRKLQDLKSDRRVYEKERIRSRGAKLVEVEKRLEKIDDLIRAHGVTSAISEACNSAQTLNKGNEVIPNVSDFEKLLRPFFRNPKALKGL